MDKKAFEAFKSALNAVNTKDVVEAVTREGRVCYCDEYDPETCSECPYNPAHH